MERKRFNWILIIGSVSFLTIILRLSFGGLEGAPYILIPLYISGSIGLFLGIFGLMNFTKKNMIFKLILSAILSAIVLFLHFFIVLIAAIVICETFTSRSSCFL